MDVFVFSWSSWTCFSLYLLSIYCIYIIYVCMCLWSIYCCYYIQYIISCIKKSCRKASNHIGILTSKSLILSDLWGRENLLGKVASCEVALQERGGGRRSSSSSSSSKRAQQKRKDCVQCWDCAGSSVLRALERTRVKPHQASSVLCRWCADSCATGQNTGTVFGTAKLIS